VLPFPVGSRSFSFIQNIQTLSGARSKFHCVKGGAVSLGPEREANPSSADLKGTQQCLVPTIGLHVVYREYVAFVFNLTPEFVNGAMT
jgi:hypothetical protein